MPDQKIHVLGYDEIVNLLSLLGIEGTILGNPNDFLKEFDKIIANPSIGMIIIALNLPDDIIDFLIDFKLNNRTPFIFYLPDIFQPNVENEDVFLKKINQSIGKIIK